MNHHRYETETLAQQKVAEAQRLARRAWRQPAEPPSARKLRLGTTLGLIALAANGLVWLLR